jgi:hypothetical protein
MTANKLQAVAAAFLISTAAIGASMVLTTVPASAAVRAEVGNPLLAAQKAAAAKDYKGAMADIDKANAVANKTPEETALINQMKTYVGSISGDVSLGGAAAVKTKLSNDYNAKNYAAVIADGEQLQKAGGMTADLAQVVAQAYYLSGNKAGCIKYVKGMSAMADETTLQLQMKCAYDTNDEADQRDALEQLVAKTGKAEYWTQILKMADTTKGLTDHQSLNIYRLKYLTGTLATKDDYVNMAQLDLQLGFPQEAAMVLDKGAASGLVNDDRSKKLAALAKQQAGQVAAGQAAAISGAKDGDALIKVAEQQAGAGNAKDAVTTAKNGIAKGAKDKDQAAIVLAWAQVSSGASADAVKTIAANKGDGTGPMIAHLYGIYAAHPKAVAAAAPAAPAKK